MEIEKRLVLECLHKAVCFIKIFLETIKYYGPLLGATNLFDGEI